jgi:hypothetical protein
MNLANCIVLVLFLHSWSMSAQVLEETLPVTIPKFNFEYYDSGAPWAEINSEVLTDIDCREYLTMWKRLFMVQNKMDASHFDSHVKVRGVNMVDTDRGNMVDTERGDMKFKFVVIEYTYSVDWARVTLTDGFIVTSLTHKLSDMIDTTDYEYSFRVFKETLPPEFGPWEKLHITRLNPVDCIISKEDVVYYANEASPLFWCDVNLHIRISLNGDLSMELGGTVDDKANKCINAEIRLADGKVSEITETACRIY